MESKERLKTGMDNRFSRVAYVIPEFYTKNDEEDVEKVVKKGRTLWGKLIDELKGIDDSNKTTKNLKAPVLGTYFSLNGPLGKAEKNATNIKEEFKFHETAWARNLLVYYIFDEFLRNWLKGDERAKLDYQDSDSSFLRLLQDFIEQQDSKNGKPSAKEEERRKSYANIFIHNVSNSWDESAGWYPYMKTKYEKWLEDRQTPTKKLKMSEQKKKELEKELEDAYTLWKIRESNGYHSYWDWKESRDKAEASQKRRMEHLAGLEKLNQWPPPLIQEKKRKYEEEWELPRLLNKKIAWEYYGIKNVDSKRENDYEQKNEKGEIPKPPAWKAKWDANEEKLKADWEKRPLTLTNLELGSKIRDWETKKRWRDLSGDEQNEYDKLKAEEKRRADAPLTDLELANKIRIYETHRYWEEWNSGRMPMPEEYKKLKEEEKRRATQKKKETPQNLKAKTPKKKSGREKLKSQSKSPPTDVQTTYFIKPETIKKQKEKPSSKSTTKGSSQSSGQNFEKIWPQYENLRKLPDMEIKTLMEKLDKIFSNNIESDSSTDSMKQLDNKTWFGLVSMKSKIFGGDVAMVRNIWTVLLKKGRFLPQNLYIFFNVTDEVSETDTEKTWTADTISKTVHKDSQKVKVEFVKNDPQSLLFCDTFAQPEQDESLWFIGLTDTMEKKWNVKQKQRIMNQYLKMAFPSYYCPPKKNSDSKNKNKNKKDRKNYFFIWCSFRQKFPDLASLTNKEAQEIFFPLFDQLVSRTRKGK